MTSFCEIAGVALQRLRVACPLRGVVGLMLAHFKPNNPPLPTGLLFQEEIVLKAKKLA
ncbi:MAG: hypothetical protein QE263_08210 [Vampirovibrionales bacterium]|nr:hypothetical protein [Vampirovibrionales bacterium]